MSDFDDLHLWIGGLMVAIALIMSACDHDGRRRAMVTIDCSEVVVRTARKGVPVDCTIHACSNPYLMTTLFCDEVKP